MRRIFLLFATVMLLVSCQRQEGSYRQAKGTTWGTFYTITYESDKQLDDSIRAAMEQVDMSLSAFNDSSILSRVNRGEDVVVDSLFTTVFHAAEQVAQLSGGRFDPTVGPLVNLWGFGYKEGTESPTAEQIATALATVGIARCTLADGRVQKSDPATEFDFAAIAKGFGCDVVARMLERNGCQNYLVEIGGEMALKGVNDRGEKWRIQIDAPVESRVGTHQRAALISVSDCGVASSGNYRNYRDTDSGRVGHTISPKTGYPVKTELLAVTVIAPDGMWADALATACMAMPIAEACTMIESLPDTEALFITAGKKDGEFTITATPGFPERL